MTGVALLGLLAVYWFAARSKTELASASAAANQARVAEEAKLQLATRRRTMALEQRTTAEKEMASLKQESAEPIKSTSDARPSRIPTIPERLRTEPDAQVLWLKLQRDRLTSTYDPLFRRLELNTEQISRFENNVIRKEEQQMDLNAISTEQKKSTGTVSPETAEMLERVNRDYLAAQRALLGEQAFQEWQDYEQTTSVRNWVNGWAGGAIAYLGNPLTQDQGEQLVQIIANANDGYRKGAGFSGAVDWPAVETAAKQILTPQQFRFFTEMEPPLPYGGRFQNELYQRVRAAAETETKLAGKK